MLNKDIQLLGRNFYEKTRLPFAEKYIIYRSHNEKKAHAWWDIYTHFSEYFSFAPRFFHIATQGTSGKSTATELSSFFVRNPIMFNANKAGAVRKVAAFIRKGKEQKELLPTALMDEAQEAFGPQGNDMVFNLLNSYRSGWLTPIYEPKAPDGYVDLDLYCPCGINGLTTKYDIPQNFLERCIINDLPRRNPDEVITNWRYDQINDVYGSSFRDELVAFAKDITNEDILPNRTMVETELEKRGVFSRELDKHGPIAEIAYLCGDTAFEEYLSIAEYFAGKSKTDVKLTLREELLKYIWNVFDEIKPDGKDLYFLRSGEMCHELNDIHESPWPTYKRHGLNENNLAYLLKPYGIKPCHSSDKRQRGYYLKDFADTWKRVLGLDMPQFAHEFYK